MRVAPFVIPPAKPKGDAKRQRERKERLERSGGRRIPFNLPGDAVAALEDIKARDGHKNLTAAVIAAIHQHAKGPTT